jgi:phage tail-like protein
MFFVEGIEIGAFTEVSGLQVELDRGTEEEIKEGGQNEFTYKLPGRMKWPNLVLKRGVTSENRLFEWFKRSSGEGFAGNHNRLDRKLAALAMVDGTGEPLRYWVFLDAFPVKWTGPKFAASASDVAMEELEVAHHGFWVEDA